jgi:hypothetical protein
MSYAVSGATTIPAIDLNGVVLAGPNSALQRAGAASELSGLTPGSTTFTARYRVSAANVTCTYANRTIVVLPLP